jgi:RpiR family transcriptional regulator, carbohydrate utilization regulator
MPSDAKAGHTPIDLISNLRGLDRRLPAREQQVADYVLANLEQISGMTIAALALAAGVSSPTVVRFCRSMGCDGFRDFKIRLAQNLAVSLQYLVRDQQTPPAAEIDIVDQVIGALSATLNVLRHQFEPDVFSAASSAIVGANTILVAGIGGGSSMLAQETANRLFRLGIPTTAVSDSYVLQMRAATLKQTDMLLAISASGEADEIVSAAEVAGGYGAVTLAITKTGSSLARVARIALQLDLPEDPDIHKPTASRYAFLVLIDALAMAVAQKRPAETTENLRRIRASLTAYHGRTGPQPLGD